MLQGRLVEGRVVSGSGDKEETAVAKPEARPQNK